MAGRKAGPTPEGKFVSANGLDFHYREWGAGRPLVLLHGATDTHMFWSPVVPPFSEKYRIIAPDNRGHGWTISPDLSLTYAIMADDLAALTESLRLDRPLIFGYSDGGQAALDLGIRYPELPGALVLGGVWFRFSHQYQNAISRSGFISPGEIDYGIYEKQAPRDWEERMRKAHHDPRGDYPRLLLAALAKLWWTPLDYSEEDFRRITAPVLILIGEEDQFIPLEEAKALAAKIPQAELALIPDAGHDDLVSREGVFIDLVLDFLERRAS